MDTKKELDFYQSITEGRSEQVDSVYISYLLRSSSYWNHINSIAFGTTSQPNIQINQLNLLLKNAGKATSR